MKLNFAPFILLICFAFISCGDKDIFERKGDGTLLKQVLIEGEVYQEFSYTDSDLIKEEKSKFHYSKHHYNSKNQLIQSDHYWDERMFSSSFQVLEEARKRTEWVSPDNSEKDSYNEYKYNRNGRLEKTTTYRLNTGYSNFTTYSYNNKGRIGRCTYFYENKASGFRKYFHDSKGNLIKEEHYWILGNDSEQLQTTTEYKYDSKRNPYNSYRGLMTPGRNTNPNNIIKKTYTIHGEVDSFIEPVQVTEYNYQYNQKGYPISRNDSFEYVYY